MEGCMGRPDISLHMGVAIFASVILGCRLYVGSFRFYKMNEIEEKERIARRLRCDKYNNYKIFDMVVTLNSVARWVGFPLTALYHLFTSLISSTLCHRPPSILADVFYWIVAGILAMYGIGWMVSAGRVVAQWARRKTAAEKKEQEDKKELMKLLQTVNDAKKTEQTAVTAIHLHLPHYQYNCLNLKYTCEYVWRLMLESIVNICTVDTELICKEGEIITSRCKSCDNLIERSDFVVMFYGKDEIYHEHCILHRVNYPLSLILRNDSLDIHWPDQQRLLAKTISIIRQNKKDWTINDLRSERLQSVNKSLQIQRSP